MKFINTNITDVKIIEPEIFEDNRGYFFEFYNKKKFSDNGINEIFLQSNHSKSIKNTLRGLHYQDPLAQGKLVRCIDGKILDVAVDIRKDSNSFCEWVSVTLSSENRKQLYVPPGFAHGFLVLSNFAQITYQCTELYNPIYDKGVLWSDKKIGINWGIDKPILSKKDAYLPLID